MRAVAYRHIRPVTADDALVDVEIDRPRPGANDLLVKVEAVSVNPVDTKVRRRNDPGGEVKVLGYDAAGTVVETGGAVTLFKPGDAVWYAGSNARPGTDAEFHAVDERIVGPKPARLDFAESAALPLTALTAWELLFDRIGAAPGPHADRRSLLIVGGGGGVGSIAIQLAAVLTGMTVVATASRPATIDWVKGLGAHHVIDHSKPMQPQLAALGLPSVDVIMAFAGTKAHATALADIVAPEGHIGMIEGDGPTGMTPEDFGKLFQKAVALHFELMFVRPRGGATMIRQHEILREVAALVDAGKLRTTMTEKLSPISAATLRQAHAMVESGRTIGKVVVAGWPG
jgi:zinc-binding alcohol dehydrogenase family protein